SSGFMPASYQATVMRSKGDPILDLKPPSDLSLPAQRRLLDTLREYNEEHLATRSDNSNLAARIASYELAFKMQQHAPEAVDIARRLVERGVRFIQIYSGGHHNDANWDAHTDMEANHNLHAAETDKPIAGLLTDLKQRGLLDKTLVVWSGEFGRQPTAEYAKGTGRDHNSYGFTSWMAGGGIKGGTSYG